MLTVHGKFMNQLTGTLNEKLMVHIFSFRQIDTTVRRYPEIINATLLLITSMSQCAVYLVWKHSAFALCLSSKA